MLQHLEIHNIALIDSVIIEPGEKFNIFTGETGAGKSIIIDAINAILGQRISKELIRTGCDKATVEAVFKIEASFIQDVFETLGMEPELDNILILSREFTTTGKNICRVNGKMVTVSVLKQIGERIIDIHGQYDNQSLLRTESHINLLDSFSGDKLKSVKKEYSKLLEEYKEINKKIFELTGDRHERERRIDLLKFQINEIKKAKLKPDEDKQLEKDRLIYVNSQKILDALSSSYDLLFSGNRSIKSTIDSLNDISSFLQSISKFDEKYQNIYIRLQEQIFQLEDLASEIRNERDSMDYDPIALEQVEERVDEIFKLKRKYGVTIDEIIKYYKQAEIELNNILNCDETVKELEKQVTHLEKQLYTLALQLHDMRLKAAEILDESVCKELDDLEMKRASFKTSIEFDDKKGSSGERIYNTKGLNKVEFLISPNVGEPLKPLSKIASGGEMSRIMLAIKKILADVDEMPTLIFDEIDIGISGKASQKVGEKLSYISKNHQVICVTHLAQIASMADNHFLIQKESDDVSTRTIVENLTRKSVIKELSRILGGANISSTTTKLAEEMLKNAINYKNAT